MLIANIVRRPRWGRWGALCLLACCLALFGQRLLFGQAPNHAVAAISGTVVDPNGNFVVGALIRIFRGDQMAQETLSDREGHFVLLNVPPGPYQLRVSAEGFAPLERPEVVYAGEALDLLQVPLAIAGATTEIQVSITNHELAEEEIKVEETQRVLGVIPNFYVTYNHEALPLSTGQKFELAWKTLLDPVTFAASGGIAGVEQATNSYRGYGQGAAGYAKRYGASYGDALFGIMLGGALLPALLKQDPRYYYKGTGSTRSRVFYALANAVVCKGDNGHWQPDYSGVLGSLASGGISNLYYPASSRHGAGLTFENTLVGIGGSGIGNIFQEFLVRKLTPHKKTNP